MTHAPARDFALGAFLDSERAAFNAALDRLLPALLADVPAPLAEPVAYALRAGGKRLRPLLCIAAYRAAGGSAGDSGIHDVAASLELIHTYSLIHDDLPCMDDDDLRRGRATTHRVYGVPAAVSAGAALVPLACRAALAGAARLGLPDAEAAAIVAELCRAAGAEGMVGGQLLDLDAEGSRLPLDEMERVHRCKTGALLASAVRLGALAARAEPPVLRALQAYGDRLGLAFQIADDVLDVTASSDALGKTAGKDAAVEKSTFVALLGVEGARERARLEAEAAVAALEEAGLAGPELQGLARHAVKRTH